jgi:hypothetical protein
MFKVTITMTRPTVDTNFTDGFPEAIKEYIQDEFIETGKLISKDVDFSDDKLTKTITRIFKSEEDFNSWVNDSTIDGHRQARNSQAAAVGITITETSELI